MGLTSFFVTFLSCAQYYAVPETRWWDVFLEYVTSRQIPRDDQAI